MTLPHRINRFFSDTLSFPCFLLFSSLTIEISFSINLLKALLLSLQVSDCNLNSELIR